MTKEYWTFKKQAIRKYYHQLFFVDRKRLLTSYAVALTTMFCIFLISFLIRQYYIDTTFDPQSTADVAANTGISFGLLSNNPALVYTLQIIPIVVTAIAVVHNKKYITAVGIALVFSAGLSNAVDRAVPDYFGSPVAGAVAQAKLYVAHNAVVDY